MEHLVHSAFCCRHSLKKTVVTMPSLSLSFSLSVYDRDVDVQGAVVQVPMICVRLNNKEGRYVFAAALETLYEWNLNHP